MHYFKGIFLLASVSSYDDRVVMNRTMKLFLLIWWIKSVPATVYCLSSQNHCAPMNPPPSGTLAFFFGGQETHCRPKCAVGVTAILSCNRFYAPKEPDETARCLADGSWFPRSLACVPACGASRAEVSLIVNGPSASPGAFPWHVAIYNVVENHHEFWCAGTLVSDTAVVTAAHCTWKIQSMNLVLAFGKFRRKLDFEEPHVQLIGAKKVEILESYQDASGNYNGDISVVFLVKPVRLNLFVSPVCIDWDQTRVDEHLKEGTLGTVLGWGITENETFSDDLRMVKLPVASDSKCIAEQENDFRKFVTYTSFCAGYRNGTGVCNGDSGGGLVFWDETSSRWYLQGVVSVSPRRKGTPFCDPNYYTVFTKVSPFVKWFKKLKIQGAAIRPKAKNSKKNYSLTTRDPYAYIRRYLEKYYDGTKSKMIFGFPHTKKMMEFIK